MIDNHIITKPLFTKEECNHITEIMGELEPIPGKVAGNYRQLDENTRKVKICAGSKFVRDYNNGEYTWIQERLYKVVKDINEKIYKFDIVSFEKSIVPLFPIQFLRYEEGDFYNEHTDMGSNMTFKSKEDGKVYGRTISMSLQLSEENDYEGGHLVMVNEDEQYSKITSRKQGDLILFPSPTKHAVTEVTSGKRDCLVWWVLGPYDDLKNYVKNMNNNVVI